MKQYTKIRVGIKDHIPQIKGAPLTVFIWMSATCDRCGVFHQSLATMVKGTGYGKPALVRATHLLQKKNFIKKIGCNGLVPIWWIRKHDPKVEAMVTVKGEGFLVDNSQVLKNLGVKNR